jgi:hypothetical protein
MAFYRYRKCTNCDEEYPYTIPDLRRSGVSPVFVNATCPKCKAGVRVAVYHGKKGDGKRRSIDNSLHS